MQCEHHTCCKWARTNRRSCLLLPRRFGCCTKTRVSTMNACPSALVLLILLACPFLACPAASADLQKQRWAVEVCKGMHEQVGRPGGTWSTAGSASQLGVSAMLRCACCAGVGGEMQGKRGAFASQQHPALNAASAQTHAHATASAGRGGARGAWLSGRAGSAGRQSNRRRAARRPRRLGRDQPSG